MKIWLALVTERDQFYNDEQDVRKFESHEAVLQFAGSVAAGNVKDIAIDAIFSADFSYSAPQLKPLELTLENFKLALREKK
ncbi:hypothetical protein [Paenibacillus humicus]|uniref:hypothetical protein n=1 Tax=Paenibacillus humicus TaxID=412861 RepID=UPI003F14CEC8